MTNDSDDSLASPQTAPEDGSKGQRLILYIPHGAVIVERIGSNESGEQITAVDGHPKNDEQSSAVNVANNSAGRPIERNEGPVAETGKSSAELNLMYQIAQTLDQITKRMGQGNQLGITATPAGFSEPFIDSEQELLPVQDDAAVQQTPVECKKEHHIHWMHTVNVSFVAFITILALLPGTLATFFGVSLYSAHRSNFAGAIHKGDLMITRLTPISQLRTDDLILVRQSSTWTPEVRKVKQISATSNGLSTSITSETDKGVSSSSTISNNSNSIAHKVTRVVPSAGTIQDALNSIYVRVGIGLFLLSLNLFGNVRRRARIHAGQNG